MISSLIVKNPIKLQFVKQIRNLCGYTIKQYRFSTWDYGLNDRITTAFRQSYVGGFWSFGPESKLLSKIHISDQDMKKLLYHSLPKSPFIQDKIFEEIVTPVVKPKIICKIKNCRIKHETK